MGQIAVDQYQNLIQKIDEQGRKLDQVREEVGKIGRLEERIAAHMDRTDRAEQTATRDIDNLWIAHREIDGRVRALEGESKPNNARWQFAENIMWRVATPLILALAMYLAADWVKNRDARIHMPSIINSK